MVLNCRRVIGGSALIEMGPTKPAGNWRFQKGATLALAAAIWENNVAICASATGFDTPGFKRTRGRTCRVADAASRLAPGIGSQTVLPMS